MSNSDSKDDRQHLPSPGTVIRFLKGLSPHYCDVAGGRHWTKVERGELAMVLSQLPPEETTSIPRLSLLLGDGRVVLYYCYNNDQCFDVLDCKHVVSLSEASCST